MARTVAQIQATIVAAIAADATLPNAIRAQASAYDPNAQLSTSKRAFWNLITYIVASAQGIEEQLMDSFKADIEELAATVPPGTPEWVQAKILLFQYDESNPQIIQLVDLVPQYLQFIPSDQIVSRCSVTTDLSGNVTIKVATGNPPAALTDLQLAALQDYINTIGFAGITYTCTTANPDQLYIAANIYYQGQYSAVIQANVIAAITNYLAAIPFDGDVLLSDLEAAIKAVPGVVDVVLQKVGARQDGNPLNMANLVNNSQILNRLWNTVSGYIIGETSNGNTLSSTLNFLPQ
jgi:hypothetical protein